MMTALHMRARRNLTGAASSTSSAEGFSSSSSLSSGFRFSEMKTLRDVPEHILREISMFFQTYKVVFRLLVWVFNHTAVNTEAMKKSFSASITNRINWMFVPYSLHSFRWEIGAGAGEMGGVGGGGGGGGKG